MVGLLLDAMPPGGDIVADKGCDVDWIRDVIEERHRRVLERS